MGSSKAKQAFTDGVRAAARRVAKLTRQVADLGTVRQSGALPYRWRGGRLEVLLVTSRRSGQWIVPKGHVEGDLGPSRSAAKEAMEEAGVTGKIGQEAVGRFTYRKGGRRHAVDVYDLAVGRELTDWPERDQRKREWLRVPAAAKRVRNARLRELIEGLPRRLRHSPPAARLR